MKNLCVLTLAVFTLLVSAPLGASDFEILFFDDFEAVDALDRWEIESTNQGRVQIAGDPRDASNQGLLMDDMVNDVIFSQNIARTTVSIAGFTDIQVSAEVYSFNNHVHTIAGFDGIVLRAGNLMRRFSSTWEVEQSFSIVVDEELRMAAAAGDGLLTIELQQYGNFSVPHNGLLFDDVKVTGRPIREIHVVSPLVILKSEPLELILLVDPSPGGDVELSLLRDGNFHAKATYPKEVEMAALTFPNFDNNTLDGDQFYQLVITDGHFSSLPFHVLVLDDTPAGLDLLLPESITEGATAMGTVSVTSNRTTAIEISLETSDPSVASVPQSVTLQPHSSTINFPITTFKDPRVLDDRVVCDNRKRWAGGCHKRSTGH